MHDEQLDKIHQTNTVNMDMSYDNVHMCFEKYTVTSSNFALFLTNDVFRCGAHYCFVGDRGAWGSE